MDNNWNGMDYLSHDGADKLRLLIRDYWLKRGYDVNPEVVQIRSEGGHLQGWRVRLPPFPRGFPPPYCRIKAGT